MQIRIIHARPAPTPQSDLVCYIRCPECGRPIQRPFSRRSGPVVESHRAPPPGRFCRLVVTPAREGDGHQIERVRADESFEQALLRALARS